MVVSGPLWLFIIWETVDKFSRSGRVEHPGRSAYCITTSDQEGTIFSAQPLQYVLIVNCMVVAAAFPHCSLCFGQIDREKVRKLASSNWKPKTGQACTMLRICCSGSQGTLNNRQKTYHVFTHVYLCYIQLSWACNGCVSHSLSNMLDFSNQLFQNEHGSDPICYPGQSQDVLR